MSKPLRVRFAPSPTGYLHIGGARTALFNWLIARQSGGVFVLRMEDTDEARNTDAARQTIFEGLQWLGLEPDEGPEEGGDYGPYSQSERQSLYVEYADVLKEKGALYPCFATKDELATMRAEQEAKGENFRYDGRYRDLDPAEARRRIDAGEEHTWRLRVPADQDVVIHDLVRGDVTVKSADIEDIILIRGNGVPVYNLAVVIDDELMKIDQVVRGEDHLTNTFKQVLIYQAFGWDLPVFAHLPLILGPTGQGKLSKRKHPEAAIELYREKGYPVDALLNWLALVGWSLDDKTEVFSRDDLVRDFSFAGVNASGARLPMDKLDWISGEYIRQMDRSELSAALRPFLMDAGRFPVDANEDDERRLTLIVEAAQDRIRSYSDIIEQTDWVFESPLTYEAKAAKNFKKPTAVAVLDGFLSELVGKLSFDSPDVMEKEARAWTEEREMGFGQFVQPMRAALTGRSQGPGLFHCLAILGQEQSVARVEAGLERAREAAADS